MPHLISNLYEKNYTPFTAKLAPRNLWNRPVLGKYQIRLFFDSRFTIQEESLRKCLDSELTQESRPSGDSSDHGSAITTRLTTPTSCSVLWVSTTSGTSPSSPTTSKEITT